MKLTPTNCVMSPSDRVWVITSSSLACDILKGPTSHAKEAQNNAKHRVSGVEWTSFLGLLGLANWWSLILNTLEGLTDHVAWNRVHDADNLSTENVRFSRAAEGAALRHAKGATLLQYPSSANILVDHCLPNYSVRITTRRKDKLCSQMSISCQGPRGKISTSKKSAVYPQTRDGPPWKGFCQKQGNLSATPRCD